MGTERKRKVSLFDVVDETAVSTKLAKSNGGSVASTNSMINRWNGRPYSHRYYEILEKRKTLPVWHQKDEFLQVLRDNQSLILVGETGSGKTTQVCWKNLGFCFDLFGSGQLSTSNDDDDYYYFHISITNCPPDVGH